MSPIFNKI